MPGNRIELNLITDILALLNAGYRATYAYAVGDCTSYGGKYYTCIKAGTGQRPDISPTYWTALFAGAAINREGRQDEAAPAGAAHRVAVWVDNCEDAFHDGFMNSGVYKASVMIQAQSYAVDDADRADLHQLEQCLRDVLLWKDSTAGVNDENLLVTSLNSLSGTTTYFGVQAAMTFGEPTRNGLHLWNLPLELVFSPVQVS